MYGGVYDRGGPAAQPASDTLDTLAATTPGAAGLELLEDGNAAEIRETAGLGDAAVLNLATATPAGATALAGDAFEWDFCAPSVIGAMMATPPTGLTTVDSVNVAVDREADGEINWVRDSTSRSEDRPGGAFPHWSVTLRSRKFRVLSRFTHSSSGLYRLWMYGIRIGTTLFVGACDYNDSGTRRIELWSSAGGVLGTVTYGSSDVAVWICLEGDGDNLALRYSTATAMPSLDDWDTNAANGWVAVGSASDLPMSGLPRLCIGSFDTSSFGHTVKVHNLKVTGW